MLSKKKKKKKNEKNVKSFKSPFCNLRSFIIRNMFSFIVII